MDNNISAAEAAARRQALASALKNGLANNEPIVVTPSGEVEFHHEALSEGVPNIQVPDGKLA